MSQLKANSVHSAKFDLDSYTEYCQWCRIKFLLAACKLLLFRFSILLTAAFGWGVFG